MIDRLPDITEEFKKPHGLSVAKEVLLKEWSSIQFVSNALNNKFLAAIDLLLECKGRVIVMGVGKSGHVGTEVLGQEIGG